MSIAAIAADIVPPRPLWRSLLWSLPLTLLWTALIIWRRADIEIPNPLSR